MAAKRKKLAEEEIVFPDIRIYILPQRIPKARLEILKNATRRNGFHVVENFSPSVTHVVSNYDNKEKVLTALDRQSLVNVEVVNLNWLTSCTTTGKPVLITDKYRIQSKKQKPEVLSPNLSCASSISDSPQTESTSTCTKYICQRSAPLNHPNKKFTDALEVLERHALYTDSSHRDSRALAFRRAACSLKSLTKIVENIQDVSNLNNIGGHSRQVIKEILEKGFCDEVEKVKSSDFFDSMEKFAPIYGCGPATSRKWIEKGFKSIEDIKRALEDEHLKVTEQQHMGILYYEGVANGVTRSEADAITEIVMEQLNDLEPGCTIQLVGGYRRGKMLGHDVDILITHTDDSKVPSLLPKLVQRLDRLGHIVHKDMSIGKNPANKDNVKQLSKPKVGGTMDQLDHCFCMFKMETKGESEGQAISPNSIRRVDLIVAPPSQYCWALVGWTGSKQFNRSLRLYASKELNIAISNHGAWDNNKMPPQMIEAYSEKEIFSVLKLTYREPEERNC